jgi:hypothetical protein
MLFVCTLKSFGRFWNQEIRDFLNSGRSLFSFLEAFEALFSRGFSLSHAVNTRRKQMRRLSWALALATLAQVAQSIELLKNEAMILYSDVSPKLRIITKSSAFSGGNARSALARFEVYIRA